MRGYLRFDAPLYVHLGPDVGPAELVDVNDGLQALQMGAIGRYRFDPRGCEREAWSTALDALARAKFEPRPDYTGRARSALRTLAIAAGALVTPTPNRAYLALCTPSPSARSLANTSVAQRS
jgi:hypothetical protein